MTKITDVLAGSTTKAVADFLANAPDDEVYTVKELSGKFDIPESTLKNSRALKTFNVKFEGRSYFGSLAAIEKLPKEDDED